MIISKTPLRCSFFGGGTDFENYFSKTPLGYGSTISTALKMYVYITVNKRFENSIRLCYSGNELVDSVDEIKHNIIREALKLLKIDNGIEIFYAADIPLSGAGIGLASSSALAVGLLNALHAYKGECVSPEVIAREACQIEIEKIGQRIGIQDQFAVSYGGFRRYRYYANGEVTAEPIICNCANLNRLKNNLMLFYTGITRDSRVIFKEQNETVSDKMLMLDDMVKSVDTAYRALNENDIDKWGYMLNESWEKKKKFASGVTNLVIDDMYERAKKAGALGGKILGAGGGGFMLLYVPIEKQENVKLALREFRQIEFGFEEAGSTIVFNNQ